jgi:hypothetical protein
MAVACSRAPDPDFELRTRYTERIIAERDAGVRWSLFDKEDVRFDDGWYDVDFRNDRFVRSMAEHAVTRLRTRGDQPMRLTLEGAPNLDPRKGPVWLTITIDGQRLAFFPLYGRYRQELVVPAEMLRSTTWVDLAITASYASVSPGEGRPVAYSIHYLAWEPLQADAGRAGSP